MDVMFRIHRVYESTPGEYRVLVDRLWPRGLSKEAAGLDEWYKAIAPSTAARQAFGHRAENFAAFAARYTAELDANDEAVEHMLALERTHGDIALLYAAKDPHINHARILCDYLTSRGSRAGTEPGASEQL